MGQSYQKLVEHYREIIFYDHASAMLGWDSAVMMPTGGANARADLLSFLGGEAHKKTTSDEIYDFLNKAADEQDTLDRLHLANFNIIKDKIERARLVPKDLVKEVSKLSSQCEFIWRDARKNNDFSATVESLEALLKRKKEVADIFADYLGCDRYDAMLDGFDPGRRSVDIDKVFKPLAENLPHILDNVLSRQSAERPILNPKAVDLQKKLGKDIAKDLGFDFTAGRLDVSAHPFSGGIADDVRMTARYYEADYWSGIGAVIHETGHGMYDSGMPKDWRYMAVGQSFNMGMTGHESMSLFMERHIGLHPAFFDYFVNKAFQVTGQNHDKTALQQRAYHVSRSLIRVDADEVTYPLHIILRYEIEKALMADTLEVSDMPDMWNEKMKDLLGIVPENDALGCMQDIHWFSGWFGYFPCYTLGAIAASQFYSKMEQDCPNIADDIQRGDFSRIQSWLSDHIYQKGCQQRIDDLLIDVTDGGLSAEYYLQHIQNRYLENG